MKKFTLILLSLMFALSTVLIANAGHERIDYFGPLYFQSKQMPLPDNGDLRHYILRQKSYKKWATWPGKSKQYKGTEPHGALLTTYVNDLALKSIKKKSGMTNNSIVVKENYAPNKKLMAITVMYKVDSYNPEGGDWFWVKYNANFETLASGKVTGCLDYHGTVKNNDYIFTGKVTSQTGGY